MSSLKTSKIIIPHPVFGCQYGNRTFEPWYNGTMKPNSPLSIREEFLKAVQASSSIADVLEYFGLRKAGGNYKQARHWAETHQIPLPKYNYSEHPWAKAPIDDSKVFVECSTYNNRYYIKKRLLKLGWTYKCSIAACPITDSWLGKPVSLHLDHINGVHNDNRLENLRFLCPACHTQTETYAGKNNKGAAKIKTPTPRPTKIIWPDTERLQIMVKQHGYSKTGEILGVSDNAVRKRLKRLPE